MLQATQSLQGQIAPKRFEATAIDEGKMHSSLPQVPQSVCEGALTEDLVKVGRNGFQNGL